MGENQTYEFEFWISHRSSIQKAEYLFDSDGRMLDGLCARQSQNPKKLHWENKRSSRARLWENILDACSPCHCSALCSWVLAEPTFLIVAPVASCDTDWLITGEAGHAMPHCSPARYSHLLTTSYAREQRARRSGKTDLLKFIFFLISWCSYSAIKLMHFYNWYFIKHILAWTNQFSGHEENLK